MTVPNTSTQSGPYYANGATVSFAFTFRALTKEDVEVVRISAAGVETLVPDGLYDVVLSQNAGSVRFSSPPSAGNPIFVRMSPAFTQEISLENEGAFLPEVITEGLDRAAQRALWLRARIARAISVPAGESGLTLPGAILRMGGKILGFNRVTGAVEVQDGGAFKGDPGGNIMAIGLFSSASGLSIPVGTDLVQTSGHHIVGLGPALYSAVASNPGLPGAGQFQSANGRWFRIVVQGGVDIEQFGGACDCDFDSFAYGPAYTASYAMPSAYTDNLQPLYDALTAINAAVPLAGIFGRNEVGSLIPIRFNQTLSTYTSYGFSDTIVLPWAARLQGNNTGVDATHTGTTFRFPPNKRGIAILHRVNQPAGKPKIGAGGSWIEGIWFQGGGGTDRTAHGLDQRTYMLIQRCAFAQFAGNNTNVIGFTGIAESDPRFGLTSGSSYQDIFCLQAGNWNTWVEGSDVSASVFVNLHHKGSRLGGLYDAGYFANSYTGYQNSGHGDARLGSVFHLGGLYQLSSSVPGIGGTTIPSTNDGVWEYIGPGAGANAAYPQWVYATDYRMSVPTFAAFPGTKIEGYTENYYLSSVGGTISGTMKPGRYTNAIGSDPADGGFAAPVTTYTLHFSTRLSLYPADPQYQYAGSTIDIYQGGASGNRDRIRGWKTANDPVGFFESFTGKDVRIGVGQPGTGSPGMSYYTTRLTSVTLGNPTPMPGYQVGMRFALGNPSEVLGDARRHQTVSGQQPGTYVDANSATQNRVRGEWDWNQNPSRGGVARWTTMGDGTVQPEGIVGAVRATGLNSASTAAQIVAALQAAGLVA